MADSRQSHAESGTRHSQYIPDRQSDGDSYQLTLPIAVEAGNTGEVLVAADDDEIVC